MAQLDQLRILKKLMNDADRARISSLFALLALRRRMIAAALAVLGAFLLFR